MHKCNWCKKKYTARGKLKIHVKKHHLDKLNTFIKNANTCNKCGKMFNDPMVLGGHMVWCNLTKKEKENRSKLAVHSTPHSEKLKKNYH